MKATFNRALTTAIVTGLISGGAAFAAGEGEAGAEGGASGMDQNHMEKSAQPVKAPHSGTKAKGKKKAAMKDGDGCDGCKK